MGGSREKKDGFAHNMQENNKQEPTTIIIKEYSLNEKDKKWLKSSCGPVSRPILYIMIFWVFLRSFCGMHIETTDKHTIIYDGTNVMFRIEKGTNVLQNTN